MTHLMTAGKVNWSLVRKVVIPLSYYLSIGLLPDEVSECVSEGEKIDAFQLQRLLHCAFCLQSRISGFDIATKSGAPEQGFNFAKQIRSSQGLFLAYCASFT